ncbi:hypothetical protein DFH09DRAFT_1098374 [Mycena vulgaris]|nr:hypothetical protein DFH09DRAFT_1098374 [Mycena vulgaris]
MNDEDHQRTPRQSSLNCDPPGPRGYFNSQTSDSLYYGFSDSQTTGCLSERRQYTNSRPSGVDFLILKSWGTEAERAQTEEPFLRRHLEHPLMYSEQRISEEFMAACRRTAVSGRRSPNRLPNAAKVELFSMLTRLAQCVPLLARFMMEGRWDGAKVVVDDATLNLSTVATLNWLVEDETNPALK